MENKVEVYLQSLGVDVWKYVENGYNGPKTAPIDAADGRLYGCNVRARNALLCGLVDSEFTKVM